MLLYKKADQRASVLKNHKTLTVHQGSKVEYTKGLVAMSYCLNRILAAITFYQTQLRKANCCGQHSTVPVV